MSGAELPEWLTSEAQAMEQDFIEVLTDETITENTDIERLQSQLAELERVVENIVGKTNLDTSKFAKYDAGEKVVIGDGERGLILELYVEPFELGGTEFEASQDEPLYVVGTEDRTVVVDEAELEQKDWDAAVKGDPDKVKKANAKPIYNTVDDPMLTDGFEHIRTVVNGRVVTNEVKGEVGGSGGDVGFDSWPPSWEKAETPARLIALDAWQSMGGTWNGCMKELNSAELCASFRDEIYGTTEWR